MIKILFLDEDDKNNRINEYLSKGYFIQSITYGLNENYLLFDTVPYQEDSTTVLTLEERVAVLEQTTNEILMGGI